MEEIENMRRKEKRIVNLIVVFSGLAILFIYSRDLLEDYRYFAYGRETVATITEINDRRQENGNYALGISYYNEYKRGSVDCHLNIKPRFGEHLREENANRTKVVYTKQDACDIYLYDYKHPNVGKVLLHGLIFMFALGGTYLLTKKLIREW